MGTMSDRVRAKLDLLAQRFAESLPERIGALRLAFVQAKGRKSDSEETLILRNHAHKLAGSGASFGYGSLSGLAKEMELYLDELIALKMDLLPAHRQKLKEYIAGLERECAGATKPTAEASGAVSDEERMRVAIEHETRIVLFGSDDTYISDDFARQIGFFGFPTRRVDRYRDALALREDHEFLIIIADIRFLKEHPQKRDELAKLRTEDPQHLLVVLLSDSDDFDSRLFGVRLGGSAFFATPVEIPRLVDSIDKTTAEREHTPFHVMIIDDDVEQVSLNALILQSAGMITSVATDPRNVFRVLVESKPEIVLVDLYMKGCDGRELAQLIRQQEAFIGIPIVFLSVEQDPDVQIDAIRAGGDEFLTKPVKPEHLVASIEMRAQRTRDIRYFMERDSLTGLLNHSHLIEGLNNEIRRSERIGNDLCFAMIDIDNFKHVNDSFGHLTGDRVLKSLARMLQDRLRKTDIIGRYGGEEFGIVFFNTTTEHAERILNEIRESFARIRHTANLKDFYVSFSCGLAGYPEFGTAAKLGKASDDALYKAKEFGRNRVVIAG